MKIKLDTVWLKRKDLSRLVQVLSEHNALLASRLLRRTAAYDALQKDTFNVCDQRDGLLTANACFRKELAEAQALVLGEEAHAAIIEKQEQAIQKMQSELQTLRDNNNEFVVSNEQLLAENHRLKIALRESEAKLTLITLGATHSEAALPSN